jgi:negative regulator of flagellin synthesis FlgM
VKIDPTITSTPSSAPSLTNGAQRSAPGDASTQAAAAPATPSAAATPSTAATDPVNISTISTQLRALGAGFAGNTGDIDTKRVSELKDAISKGNLSISPENIANGLIETVRGLLRQPQQQ